jgi:hypothetical protein
MTHRFYPRAAFVLGVGLSWALGGFAAQAADFSAEYVFGDSLSDRGNLAELEMFSGFFPETFRTRRATMTASPTGLWRFSSSRRAWVSTPIPPFG